MYVCVYVGNNRKVNLCYLAICLIDRSTDTDRESRGRCTPDRFALPSRRDMNKLVPLCLKVGLVTLHEKALEN
jgi:hypothetical protein